MENIQLTRKEALRIRDTLRSATLAVSPYSHVARELGSRLDILDRRIAQEGAARALRDLLNQLSSVGVYIPGEDEGQWAGLEGLSFSMAERANQV